jgi:hypothetical protein
MSARGVQAAGADFSNMIGQNVDWTGSDLTDVNFEGAVICNSTFLECKLVRTRFWRAWCEDSRFDSSVDDALIDQAIGFASTVATLASMVPPQAIAGFSAFFI